jgi:hypothetical protein
VAPYPTRSDGSAAAAGSHENQCKYDIPVVDRKQLLKRSFNFPVHVRLVSDACELTLAVEAAAFVVKPENITVRLSQSGVVQDTVYFNMLPSEPGEQTIIVSSDDTYHELQFVVYAYPYIPPEIAVWFPTLGALFGGMLTIPWIEFIQKHRKPSHAQKRRKPSHALH